MEATTRLSLSVENQKSACKMWGFVSPIQEVRRYNHHPRTGLSALAERRHELREFGNTETTHTRDRDASKSFSVEQASCSHHSKKVTKLPCHLRRKMASSGHICSKRGRAVIAQTTSCTLTCGESLAFSNSTTRAEQGKLLPPHPSSVLGHIFPQTVM